MSKRIVFIPADCDYEIRNSQILKDVCLVPCLLQQDYNYESTIAAYSIDIALLNSFFPDCKFVNTNYTGNYANDTLTYIKDHARDIDILYFFGPYQFYYQVAATFKQCNPNGKIYLKLDMNRYWLSRITSYNYFAPLLSLCDLITIESAYLHKIINQKVPYDIDYLPNGYYDIFTPEPLTYEEKENIILTVGRLGTDQKQTGVMLKSFLDANLPGWKLRLVGNIADEFLPELEEFKKHPKFASSVEFVGLIYDKRLLEEEYRKAKIFCMTSKMEGFANVFAEASKNGCYIISTDVDCAYDITDEQKYGTILPIGDYKAITKAFEEICINEEKIKEVFEEIKVFTKNEFSWQYIIAKLNLLFTLRGIV